MFAICVIPLIAMLGVAVDFGFLTQTKAQLRAASNAAALASVTATANAFSAGQQDYLNAGQVAGIQWFASQATAMMTATQPAATVTVVQSGAVFISTVTYQITVPTYFAWLYGTATVAIAGSAGATITTNAYTSITFLLDNSSSMLIAATQSGVDTLDTITPGQKDLMSVPSGLGGYHCAFACHWDANGNDYYGLARSNNIQLRFDVVQSALQSAINEMAIEQVIPNQFSVGIYTFADQLTQIYPLDMNQSSSTDLAGGLAAAQALQSPVVIDQPNTNFPAAMASLVQSSTTSGNGSSPANPRKALIIVTDGLVDYGNRYVPSSKGPINPADCNAMKGLGYDVYVLYTVYITTPANYVLPFDNIDLLPYINGTRSPAMIPSLQSCASSPSKFIQASDPAAIDTAMTQMLKAALANGGRFTR